jgi:hypothetical protein
MEGNWSCFEIKKRAAVIDSPPKLIVNMSLFSLGYSPSQVFQKVPVTSLWAYIVSVMFSGSSRNMTIPMYDIRIAVKRYSDLNLISVVTS